MAVLMSTYNGGKFLRQQINSVLAQKGVPAVELWVRDDGSTDDTKDILNSYKERGSLQWYTGQNLGPAQSFLDLVRRAPGYDWYAFADQDDFWKPDKLSRAMDCLRRAGAAQEDAALYFSNAEMVDEKLCSLGRSVYKKAPRTDFRTLACAGGCLGCTMVFSGALARAIQGKEPPARVVMHDFYVAELCCALGGRIVFDPESRMKYRQHGNNTVGVPHGLRATLANRVRAISSAGPTGIAEQAGSLTALYGVEMESGRRKWLERVARYKRSFFSRLTLALSFRTRYVNLNRSLTIRCAILLGKR